MIESFTVTKNIDAPMRDGVLLRTDLWMPKTDAPVAAILLRTPYDKGKSNPDLLRPQQCVEAGFAALVQDCRGRFTSQGDWMISYEHEGPDTYDAVEWVAAQPWCSGAVGMYGPSYLGIMQLLGAKLRPPHLKAIAPAMAPTTMWENVETGGALRLDHIITWLVFMSLDWMQRRAAAGEPLSAADMSTIIAAFSNPRALMDQRPLQDMPLFRIAGFPIDFKRLIEPAPALSIDAASFDIPTFHVGGWCDVFVRATLGMFREQRTSGTPSADRVHLLMGPWTHAGQLPQVQGQINFGMTASAAMGAVPEAHLAFFRKYLRNESVELPRVRYFMMNAGEWRTVAAWPPGGTEVRRLYLSSGGRANTAAGDGVLLSAPAAQSGGDQYVYDPSNPTPTAGGRILAWSTAAGPVDQRVIDQRDDVLCYTSEPFAAAIEIAGPVSASLVVSSSAADTDFIAKLIDVGPTGVALPVCEGVVRMRWRRGFEQAEPLQADVPERITIDLADVAWRVQPSHRLRLQVQSANYPHLDPNMNTGAAIGVDAAGVSASNRVFHGRQHPSWLEITTLSVS